MEKGSTVIEGGLDSENMFAIWTTYQRYALMADWLMTGSLSKLHYHLMHLLQYTHRYLSPLI